MPLPGLPDRSSVYNHGRRTVTTTPPPARSATVVLRKYEVLRFLGEGSNAKVFLARTLDRNGDPVVIKRIHDHVVANPRFRQFFEAEVKSMRKFAHPYVVKLLDHSLDDPFGPCLVMEFVDGVTLEQVLAHDKKLDPERAGRFLGFLCHALESAHAAGIIHRDLKPANLMVTKYGGTGECLKVMDFGFAGFAAKPHIQVAEITGEGPLFAMGTPAYVSPEMLRGDAVDGRADLYSVGVMLYEMLAGRLPFDHSTVEQVLAAHVKQQPPKFAKIGAGHIPPAVEAVVQVSLSKFPFERHATAKTFADQFGHALGWDLWKDTTPAGFTPEAPKASEVVLCTNAPIGKGGTRLNALPIVEGEQFFAYMPERLAAAKLRGFADDYQGVVAESEPGMIRLIIGLPKNHKPAQSRSAILTWLGATRAFMPEKGDEPILVSLQMEKVSANQVKVDASYAPMPEYPVRDRLTWQGRCSDISHALKAYLMATV
ncbi:MAG TPA: serine/threonine-protein kinase [Fimbriiglobus sp.]|jgi:serine/threonine protein kinase